MYTYFVRLAGIMLLLLGLTGVVKAQVSWTDTLQVRIADGTTGALKPAISGGNLVFTIEVMRPNDDWNGGDYTLGDADLYFNFNPAAFPNAFKGVGNPVFTPASGINISNSDPDVALWGEARYWAGRMQVALRMKNTGNPTKFVNLTQNTWIQLGTVSWPCDGNYANLGVVWDKPATGLMTKTGNPIIDTLMGDIKKNPDPVLQILHDTVYPNPVCAGGNVTFVCTAESSGTDLKFLWQQKAKGASNWTPITGNPVNSGSTGPGLGGLYIFKITGIGDTLTIQNVPNALDGYSFRCTAEDLTLASEPKKKIGREHKLNIRDSIRVFLSRDKDQLRTTRDTVTQCSNTNVNIRFNFYGAGAETINDIDSVYYTYIYWNAASQPTEKTVGFAKGDFTSATIPGKNIFYATLPASGVGGYELREVHTSRCNNAAIATQYDTLYIKEGDHTDLPEVTVKVNETKVVDANYDALGGTPTGIITAKGTITWDKPGTSVSYKAPATPCTDTIFYTITDKECNLTREVNVINDQYLSLKVLLEGPYRGLDKFGADTMRCIKPNIFPTDYRGLVSPYDNKLAIAALPRLTKGTICDWIYVKIRDGVKGNYVDSVSAFLRQDGVVCDTAGKPYLTFSKLPKNAYYIVVEHRSHLPIMSAKAITLSSNNNMDNFIVSGGTDFTKIVNVYDGAVGKVNEPLKKFKEGLYYMYAGYLQNKGRKPDVITNDDYAWLFKTMKSNGGLGYHLSDVTFDGFITNDDVTSVANNVKRNIQGKFW